ncbi:MAG: tripartite tricarboxylate transporter permease [Acidobacteria bacterium]|nr:tripartite tricarboxylate transporter permease [Acidobacteriota bacterium]
MAADCVAGGGLHVRLLDHLRGARHAAAARLLDRLVIAEALSPATLAATAAGSVVGLVFGAIPGLTFSMALALMMPFTFGMAPVPAIAMLFAVYSGGMTGGAVSAVLLGIPGTPSSAATVFDGYQLARRGEASLALGAAVIASAFGGLFSLLVMMLLVEQVASFAIRFGPAEIFALVLFGLSTICGLAERSMLRGLIAGVLGLMVMTIGLDEIDGVPRLTFGTVQLQQGVNMLVAMIGLFAVPQVITTFLERRATLSPWPGEVTAEFPWRRLRGYWWLMLRSSTIGTIVGAIPGTGGPIAAFLAYDHARRFSARPEAYGTGELGGIVAPESANNAVMGGALIPMLSLGIPGDPATAVILGGLLIHGLQPGPLFVQSNASLVYALYLTIVVSWVIILLVQIWGIRLFVRVLRVPPHVLGVCILVLCAIGSYAIRNAVFDVYLMAIIGVLGYLLQRLRIPLAPVVLGLVLGPTLEQQYRTALILSEGSHRIFFESPFAVTFFALTAAIVGWQIWSSTRRRPRTR